jgi:hypothetical protein
MASLERVSLVVVYYLSASEIFGESGIIKKG